MREIIRSSIALLSLLVAATAWADKRDVIIQCAQSCDAVASVVSSVGGSVTIRYNNVAALAASVPSERLADLSASASVKALAKDVVVNVPRPLASLGTKGASVVTLEEAPDVQVLDTQQVASVAASSPGDYAFNNSLIGAASLQAAGNQGQNIIVGVIDTGTANSPVVPAISGTVIGGENFVTTDPVQSATSRANDPHGTWVGTVIASHVAFGFSNASVLVRSLKANGAGTFVGACPNPPAVATCFVPMIGVAPAAKIYALKVFDSRGGGAPESRVIAAMDRAITLKRNFNSGMPSTPVSGTGSENDPFHFDSLNLGVVNMSLGGPTTFAGRDLEDQLTQQMIAVGITLAASAGNDGFAAMTGGSPGTGFGALTVGAANTVRHERILRDNQFGLGIGALYRPTTHTQTAFFSSRGPTADGRLDPDVTANGFATFAQGTCLGFAAGTFRNQCLAGTRLGAISFVSGTSFSSPTAAGAAALLRFASPTANAAQVRNALVAAANPNVLGDKPSPIDQGAGFLDVAAAATALAGGKVSSVIPTSNPNTGNEAVRQNVQRLGFDTVNFNADKFTTHVSNLVPGQVAQFFVRSRIDTTRLTVTLRNVTPTNPPAQQNQLFGDDVFVMVVDAETSFADTRVSDFVASGATYVVDNPQSGLVRVALQGDWTNAGTISADLDIVQQRDPLPGHTAKGDLSQGSLTFVNIDIPAGTAQAVFELFWDQDWAGYPTNDIDLFLIAPNGGINADGATIASPERVVIANPQAGRWTAAVSGFQVNAKDKFTLRVTADGQRLKEAH